MPRHVSFPIAIAIVKSSSLSHPRTTRAEPLGIDGAKIATLAEL